jgi:hypothetical protein
MPEGASAPARREALSPATQAMLSLAQGLIPVMTAIVGGLWVAFTYIQQQRDLQVQAANQAKVAAAQAERELRFKVAEMYKADLERLDAVQFELGQVVGRLLSRDVAKPEWNDDYQKFWDIYWGMFVVGHPELRDSSAAFGDALIDYKKAQDTANRVRLEETARTLEGALIDQVGKAEVDLMRRLLSDPNFFSASPAPATPQEKD